MFKTILTVVLSFIALVAVSFVGCAMLIGSGQETMKTDGAALAEKAGWKLGACREMFDGGEEMMCVATVNNRRLERAGDDLEDMSDALDALR